MQANQYDVYAQFLLACKELMGTLDLEKLSSDADYKDAILHQAAVRADDQIFEIANMVNRQLTGD